MHIPKKNLCHLVKLFHFWLVGGSICRSFSNLTVEKALKVSLLPVKIIFPFVPTIFSCDLNGLLVSKKTSTIYLFSGIRIGGAVAPNLP